MHNRTSGTSRTRVKQAIIGTVISVIVFFAITVIAALISYSTKDPTGILGIASLASLLFSGAASGFALSRARSYFGFAAAIISALIFSVIYLAASLIASGGIGLSHLMNLFCYLAVSLLFAFIGKGTPKKRRKRSYR